MWPYWFFLFIPIAYLACNATTDKTQKNSKLWNLKWKIMFLITIFFIGFRHENGVDWYTYIYIFDVNKLLPLKEALLISDAGYDLINWISSKFDLDIHIINLSCAFLFVWGLFVFCRAQSRPWLALTVAVPYLLIVVGMNYTRQSVAIGFIMLALLAILEKKQLKFIAYITAASLFHKTALIFLILFFISWNNLYKFRTILFLGLTFTAIYFLLEKTIGSLIGSYINTQYNSSGAGVRIFMTVVPAFLFLITRNLLNLDKYEIKIWTAVSIGALALFPFLYFSPSSTAVDRMGLYFIPLQIFYYSRLPSINFISQKNRQVITFLIIIYSALILYVWMCFAINSYAWKPYKLYPWVLLWD